MVTNYLNLFYAYLGQQCVSSAKTKIFFSTSVFRKLAHDMCRENGFTRNWALVKCPMANKVMV